MDASVSIKVSVAVLNIMTKGNLKKKGFASPYNSRSITEGSRGRNPSGNLKAGSKVEAMEEGLFLVCSSWLAQFVF